MTRSQFPQPIVSMCRLPAPKAPTRAEVEALIHHSFPEPELAAQLLGLVRPSVHLWPGPATEPSSASLRLGGLPLAPEGWAWPRIDGEPMPFIAQFDCAILAKSLPAALLPSEGTLAFFGGPDINYETFFSAGPEQACVYHWSAATPLRLTEAPAPDVTALPLSGVEAVEVYELPRNGEIATREFMRDGRSKRYFDLLKQISVTFPPGADSHTRKSTKLLGWRDNVRVRNDQPAHERLLLQIGSYDNGEAERCWIDSGCSYFTIEASALERHDFARVNLETQVAMSPDTRSRFPLPRARSRTSIEKEITDKYPDDFGRTLAAAIRPALLVWPRPAPADPMASRLGGKPLAPRDWEWPTFREEPLLFVAQINCAELKGEAAALLPRDGLLCFFGDPDVANGSDGGGSTKQAAVFYWPVGTELVSHDPPEEDVDILLTVGVEFLETLTLPRLSSSVVGARSDDLDFRMGYPEAHGIASPSEGREVNPDDLSQLLGWHSPVQGELDSCREPAWRLLLQVGTYDDGTKDHWWGPGGIIYFMIHEEHLAEQRFDGVVFDGQHT